MEAQKDVRRRCRPRSRSCRLRSSASPITPNPDVIPNAQVGVPIPRSYSFQNNFAGFTGKAVGSGRSAALGEACSRSRTGGLTALPDDDSGRRDVVPRDDRRSVGSRRPTSTVRLRVPDPSPPAALRGQAADGDSEESVTVRTRRPAPGRCRRRLRVPAGRRRTTTSTSSRMPVLGSVVGDRSGRDRIAADLVDCARHGHGRRCARDRTRPARHRERPHRSADSASASADVVVEHVTP